MAVVTRGFHGRRREPDPRIPPGQYLETDFPVLAIGPTPRVSTDDWTLTVTDVDGSRSTLDWRGLRALPAEDVETDLHCVTTWSKLDTRWRGVPVGAVLGDAGAGAHHVLAHSADGYTTNLPLADLVDGRAWVAFEYDGRPLEPWHGGPVRLLVPHLYLWKSAKWLTGLELLREDSPGFWERLGYHSYGDPWREQRYVGD
ncbi:molybdopterin-dependent oxidoreductase [Phycicoccus sp. BSK3Z-2]|uniref:Molybdopterin-dependent oxidoreductase n=1 Tax=Phycicoccus avicenniae TaxID=2828860 RepID=A0A941D6C5_9MICO|nr:molybdopterin-dependent oxidoreductase [Phycicoccus avicenniae]MBR7741948.1 molybdopterin-dependent oxidoreductase [Phycicoccus avicenniae]